MSADTITITAGRPNRSGTEKDFAGPDGTYQVMLSAVSDVVEEQSRQPIDPKRKGDDGKWVYRIWTLAIEEGEFEGQVLDLRANARSTGPKSKQYSIISAFLGRVPQVGDQVSIPDLVGHSALALILTNENDYPYVDRLMPLPARGTRAAATAPAPVAAAPVPAGRGFAPQQAAVAPQPPAEDATAVRSNAMPF